MRFFKNPGFAVSTKKIFIALLALSKADSGAIPAARKVFCLVFGILRRGKSATQTPGRLVLKINVSHFGYTDKYCQLCSKTKVKHENE